MTLTGIPFFVVVIAATVAAFVAAAVWVPRTGRSVRGFAARLLTQAGVSAMALLLVAVVLNNANGWYAGWGDLLGGDAPRWLVFFACRRPGWGEQFGRLTAVGFVVCLGSSR